MVHGDDSGLVLPPKIAPTQIMIIPINQKKEGVLDKAFWLKDQLSDFTVKVDDSDKSPGWKFSEQEIQGIPLRIEIGPRDIESNQAVIVRRDTREKIVISLDKIADKVKEVLDNMQSDMLKRAKKHRDEHTYIARNWEEFKEIANNKPGFIKAMWCKDEKCEEEIKEKTGVTSRCMPFEQEQIAEKCVCCGEDAKVMAYWGKSY